ncbi:LLM class flavin-dependent oxidoreductase [Streptomyces sp. NPDC088725]|uniref:LLM class flavin-dependent oxidoreductase n=1 Tax=Streptomyces sp. NPDC088725 TaxID=3365873 RepID=UPI0037F62758
MSIPAGSIGLNIDPSASAAQDAQRLARLAEDSGLDFIGVQDHPYHPEFFDTWTFITALTMATERLSFVTNVANTVLRPPAQLIKAASTLGLLGGNRIVLGVGAGAARPAIASYGGPEYTPGQSVAAFDEAMQIMKAMSDPAARPVRFNGDYHRINGARPGPLPSKPVPIMVGSYGPRMLRITGRLGDGWLPTNAYAPPPVVAEMQRTIDEAAIGAGRDPKAVQRIYNVMGTITTTGPVADGQNLTGPVEFWVDTLQRYRDELGFDSFLFWPVNADNLAQTALFAEQVAPHVRTAGSGGQK